MGPPKEQMSHNEIWDDSALVDSWNDAMEEYKRYHSIHRKGGNVEDLQSPKPNQNGSDAKHSTDDAHAPPGPDHVETEGEMRGEASAGKANNGTPATQHSHPHGVAPGPVPAGLLGSVRDEGLKRLLMSWYYAGYYTGYYEGQRDPPQEREQQQGQSEPRWPIE